MARPSSLPAPSHDLVLQALRKSKAPQSAYMLLEKLKKTGIKSAPIVYRALDTLMASGVVHRIKALNAFVACNCSPDHHHALSVITVCNDCEKVEELHDHSVIDHLTKLRKLNVPLPKHAVIELPVICNACAS